jgi:hypothetical protein
MTFTTHHLTERPRADPHALLEGQDEKPLAYSGFLSTRFADRDTIEMSRASW